MNTDSENAGHSEGGIERRLDGEENLASGASTQRSRQGLGPRPSPEPTEAGRGSSATRFPVRLPQPQVLSPNEIPRYPEYPPQPSRVPIHPVVSTNRPPRPAIRTRDLVPFSSQQRSHPQGHFSDRQITPSQIQGHPQGRGIPPQRPPRPAYVPPLHSLDTAEDHSRRSEKVQGSLQPDGLRHHKDGSQNPPNLEPSAYSPTRPSTSSANIPDFPLPTIAPLNIQQPRRSLGPPPSARKGSSTYYPQNSFVAPIPEEMSDAHSSYASSHVMPNSWGDGPLDYYIGGGIQAEDEPNPKSPSTDGSRTAAGDHDESTKLVTSLSTGKRKQKKSSMQLAGSSQRDPPRKAKRLHPKALTPGARASVVTEETDDGSDHTSGKIHPLGLLTPLSSNASPFPSPSSPLPSLPSIPPYSGVHSSADPRVHQILGNLGKGSAINPGDTGSPSTSTASSKTEKAAKRPPRLNLSAAKEESRASQASLPELIRRATRLASNLDRARTASRVGLMDMLGGSPRSSLPSRSGSISDILAAFPSPSIGTPPSMKWQSSTMTKSSLNKGHVPPMPELKSEGTLEKPKGRRCCGMPAWVFLLLMCILLLLIAAAVVIPITLIVLPRLRHTPPSLASCKQKALCQNGGTPLVVGKSCGCICANGFTGSTCTTVPDLSCTFSDIKVGVSRAVYQNATVGIGVARLFVFANSSFGIPLDSTRLLSFFSSSNLSCSAETVLISFDAKPLRRSLPMQFVMPSVDLVDEPESSPRPSKSIRPLSPHLLRRVDAPGAASSNGIIFAAPPTTVDTAPSPPQATPTADIIAPLPSPRINPSAPSNTNGVPAKATDFARVAVLFILQEKTLNTAIAANKNLQEKLADSKTWNTSAVFAGEAVLVDFGKWTVDLGNGTVFGGTAGNG